MNQFLFYVWYYYSYVVNSVYDFYREFVDRLTIPPPPAMVYKVVCFPTVTECACCENTDSPRDEKPECVCCAPEKDMTHEYQIGRAIRPTPEYRVEYRVQWKRSRKYRVVCSRDTDPSPHHDMFASVKPDPRKCIAMAVLNNPVESKSADVIQRVLKFAGPNHDFFGHNAFRMRWMFEHDDLLPESELHLLYTDGRLIKYGPDDILA